MVDTSFADVTNYVFELLNSNKQNLGVDVVHYGDQEYIFTRNAICVDPGQVTNTLASANRYVQVEFKLDILIYYEIISENNNTNKLEVTTAASRIEDLLNDNPRLGGLVTHSYVSQITPGVTMKGTDIRQAVQVVLECTWRRQLKSI